MSQTVTRDRPPMAADPFRSDFGAMSAEPATNLPALATRGAGSATDQALAEIITAQKVSIKRDLGRVIQNIQAAAKAAGQKFYYSWDVNDRANNRKTLVEGLAIKGAMAVATLYGNCKVEAVIANETQSHITFAARFVDYETGFTLLRLFQQRKGQNTGMKDGARAADMVFQIGQSKAIRNVIVQALPLFCEEALDCAKTSLLERISNNPEGARRKIADLLLEHDIELLRVERVVGRALNKWSAQHMARVWAEITSIAEGLADPDDLYPAVDGDEKQPVAESAAAATAAEAAEGGSAAKADEGAKGDQRAEDQPRERADPPPRDEEARGDAGPTEEAKPRARKAAEPKPETATPSALDFGG